MTDAGARRTVRIKGTLILIISVVILVISVTGVLALVCYYVGTSVLIPNVDIGYHLYIGVLTTNQFTHPLSPRYFELGMTDSKQSLIHEGTVIAVRETIKNLPYYAVYGILAGATYAYWRTSVKKPTKSH
jgi:hypothetical protein